LHQPQLRDSAQQVLRFLVQIRHQLPFDVVTLVGHLIAPVMAQDEYPDVVFPDGERQHLENEVPIACAIAFPAKRCVRKRERRVIAEDEPAFHTQVSVLRVGEQPISGPKQSVEFRLVGFFPAEFPQLFQVFQVL